MIYTFKSSPWSSHTLLLNSLPPSGESRRVLDVGCGDGYLSALLASRGYRATGIERPGGYSDKFPQDVTLVVSDLEAGLPPLTDKYDYVLCADILEHLRDPEHLLRQVCDVLAPGGELVASLPNSGNIWFRGNVLFGRFPQDDKGLFDRTHVRFYTWDGWRKLLTAAGFRLTSVRQTSMPLGLMVPPEWEHSLPVRTAESVFYGLARCWSRMFAYQFVIRAEPVRK